MGDVVLDISVSLDGFAAGRDVSQALPLGEAGHRLHGWMFGDGASAPTEQDRQAAATSESIGSYLVGRRTYDVGVDLWGEDGAFRRPCFVVTDRGRDTVVKGPTTFTFVTDGIESALDQAKTAAGDRKVCVIGGATLARQYVRAGLVANEGFPAAVSMPAKADRRRTPAAWTLLDTLITPHDHLVCSVQGGTTLRPPGRSRGGPTCGCRRRSFSTRSLRPDRLRGRGWSCGGRWCSAGAWRGCWRRGCSATTPTRCS